MVTMVKKVDSKKFYPIRASNSLSELKAWVSRMKKLYPNQKVVIVDTLGDVLRDKNTPKQMKDYWRMRMKAGYDKRYMAYGSYSGNKGV